MSPSSPLKSLRAVVITLVVWGASSLSPAAAQITPGEYAARRDSLFGDPLRTECGRTLLLKVSLACVVFGIGAQERKPT